MHFNYILTITMEHLNKITIPVTLQKIVTEQPDYKIDEKEKKYLIVTADQINTRLMHIDDYRSNKREIDGWIYQLGLNGYNVKLRNLCELHPMLNVDCCCYGCRSGFSCGPAMALWIWHTTL